MFIIDDQKFINNDYVINIVDMKMSHFTRIKKLHAKST